MVIGKKAKDKVLSYLLMIYCALMPFEEALASSLGSVLRIVAIAIIIWLVLTKKWKLPVIHEFVPYVIWIFYSLTSIVWSESITWWQYFWSIYVFQIGFIYLVCSKASIIDFEMVKRGCILGSLLASGILILMPQTSAFTDEGRRTIMLLGTSLDPNIVASIIMVGAFCCLDAVFSLNKKKQRILYIAMVAFMLVGILFTGSRGALLSFAAGVVILLWMELRTREYRKLARRFLGLGILLIVALGILLPENLLETRFSAETILGLNELRSGSHNRYTIWMYALRVIEKAPIFGYGCGNFFTAIATVYKQTASHNLYILLMTEGGIIGLSLFLTGIVRLMKDMKKKKNSVFSCLMISICIMALTLDTITCKYFWVSLMLAYLNSKEGVIQR